MKVENSVALVTGGASGLGEGTVRMMVKGGGRAAILDMQGARAEALVRELGDAVAYFPADIRDPAQVEAAVRGCKERFGRIDLCVNAAGIGPSRRVLTRKKELYPLEDFRNIVEVDLIGLFDVLRWCALYMSENEPSEEGERGLVVNVSSIASQDGQVGQCAYSAAKGGVNAMTLPLARDLALWGIRVLTICPGIMDTPMLAGAPEQLREEMKKIHTFPKRLGRAEEFASLVREFMTNTLLNGEVVRLDAATRLA